jgi:hypothetical protein
VHDRRQQVRGVGGQEEACVRFRLKFEKQEVLHVLQAGALLWYVLSMFLRISASND